MVPAYSPLDDMETSPKEYRLCSWFPQDNLSFYGLSGNPSPAALALLRAEPDKIDWFALSGNPSEDAIEILATPLEPAGDIRGSASFAAATFRRRPLAYASLLPPRGGPGGGVRGRALRQARAPRVGRRRRTALTSL